ncbi:MAG: ATP-binding cassette domain-containing protein [Chloroflexi bacterium]|nr:ATP-binding cassette domain-containing protein [Chloroflexota bacterium]
MAPPLAAATGPLLCTEGLTKRFGGVRAVDAVDVAVQPGEVHALIGPNGSGKSTLLNLLNSIYTPTGGRILFRGRPIQRLAPHRIAAAGMARTFQNIRLFKDLTVLENVMIGADTLRYRRGVGSKRRDARQQALAALDFVDMAHRSDELAKNLP